MVWFYLGETKELAYQFVYYFGFFAVHLSSTILMGFPKTASTARLYDAAYILLTSLQWSVIGAGLHIISRVTRAKVAS